MKNICLLLMFLTGASASAYNLQKTECFGDPSKPVSAVYLAGLYNAGVQFDGVEEQNRAFLENYARANGIRIAVPVARVLNGVHQWNLTSVANMESAASAACGGAPLAPDRAIIGYSNGGKYVGELSANCKENGAYSKFIVIGYPGAARGSNCPNMNERYTAMANHSQFQNMAPQINTQLAGLGKPGTTQQPPPQAPGSAPGNAPGTAVASADRNRAIERASTATGQAFTPQRGSRNAENPTVKEPPVKPAANAATNPPKAPAQAKAVPDNCCQGECTSVDIGLNLEAPRK